MLIEQRRLAHAHHSQKAHDAPPGIRRNWTDSVLDTSGIKDTAHDRRHSLAPITPITPMPERAMDLEVIGTVLNPRIRQRLSSTTSPNEKGDGSKNQT